MKAQHPRVQVVLEVLPDERDPDGHFRIKRLLKYAGRALRLKCRAVVQVGP